MNKKILLIIAVLAISILAKTQHLETTIKVVNSRARIAIKAVGGSITGSASNYVLVVAIPRAAGDAGVVLNSPTKLDAFRIAANPVVPLPTYHDASYTYFLLFYTTTPSESAPAVFAEGVESDIIELDWSGPAKSFPVSLMSLPGGNPACHVATSQWQQYLEIGGTEFSKPANYFYQSATSNPPVNAVDYSTGTAIITTKSYVGGTSVIHTLNLDGHKNESKNLLNWTISAEMNNQGFDVQRSADGINYSSIGFVNSQAPGGFSNAQLSYTFDDNNPGTKAQSYRLKQVSFDGSSKLSNTIVINGNKSVSIDGLFPNPASTSVNVIIDAPKRDRVTVMLTDLAGKTVKQKLVTVETGINTIPVDINKLAQGSYLVKLLCQSSDCETTVGKFNKQ